MGNYLSVSRAKESFLDRLKKEREGNFIGSKLLEMSMGITNTVIEEEKPKAQLPVIQKQVSSDESSSSEEEEEEMKIHPPKVSKPVYNEPKKLDKATLDDIKRQESLKKHTEWHKEKQNAIRNALNSIDTPKNNKIVFEPPEERYQPEASNNKTNLFDEDEEMEEEEVPKSFKVKKQFEGQKGEKLFELQTRFQGDDRFKIDEKFAEADDVIDSRKKFTREELKERKKFRKEMQDWDKNELKEEHDHQLSILQSITGESTAVADKFSKPPQKGMLRFDPSNKSHQKYLDVVSGNDVDDNEDSEDSDDHKEPQQVDDKRFYEVSNNLTEAFQSKGGEAKPFSFLSMLGIKHDDGNQNKSLVDTEVKILPKNKAFQFNQVRLKYESSDTEEETEEAKKPTNIRKKPQKVTKFGKYSKNGVFHYNIFFREDDERLKEGFKFLIKPETVSNEVLQEKRQKLKGIVRNSIRKAKGDKKKNKVNFVKKRQVK